MDLAGVEGAECFSDLLADFLDTALPSEDGSSAGLADVATLVPAENRDSVSTEIHCLGLIGGRCAFGFDGRGDFVPRKHWSAQVLIVLNYASSSYLIVVLALTVRSNNVKRPLLYPSSLNM